MLVISQSHSPVYFRFSFCSFSGTYAPFPLSSIALCTLVVTFCLVILMLTYLFYYHRFCNCVQHKPFRKCSNLGKWGLSAIIMNLIKVLLCFLKNAYKITDLFMVVTRILWLLLLDISFCDLPIRSCDIGYSLSFWKH